MPTQENIQVDYHHDRVYNNTPANAVGATTSTTLRTVTAYDDASCKHVRKFGVAFTPSDITNAVINNPRSTPSAWIDWADTLDYGANFVTGKFGKGIEFEYAKAAGIFQSDITYGREMTFSMWVKPNGWSWDGTSSSDGLDHVLLHGVDGIDDYFEVQFYNSGGVLRVGCSYGAGHMFTSVALTLDDGVWSFLAFTFSFANSRIRIYKDGVLVDTDATYALDLSAAGTHSQSLGHYWGADVGFDGVVDNVRIKLEEQTDFTGYATTENEGSTTNLKHWARFEDNLLNSANVGWTYDFQGWTGSAWSSMGSVADKGGVSQAFIDGAEFSAEKIKIVVTPDAGETIAITDGDTITLSYDATTLTVPLSGETETAAFTLYLSATGSTYYDADMMYGGKRHTPDGTAALPYFTITTALAALGGAFTIVTVLDSATYDEELTIAGAYTLQAALGQMPTITCGCGARGTREVAHDGNNYDTVYVSKDGNDANAGTWWAPLLTLTHAETHVAGAIAYINIMDSETYTESITINQATTVEPIYGIIPVLNGNFIFTHGAVNIYGIKINALYSSNTRGIYSDQTIAYSGTVESNTVYNGIAGIYLIASGYNGVCNKNICYNANYGIYILNIDTNGNGTCTKNICYNNTTGLRWEHFDTGAHVFSGSLNNNISYLNDYGIYHYGTSGTDSSTVENNTVCYNTIYGYYYNANNYNCTIRDNIFYSSTTYDLYKDAGSVSTPTITESNYGTNSGFTIGAGCITTNPNFCKITSPYKFGISANSGAYKTDTSTDDMGAHLRIILIASDTATINGFNFDGNEQYNNAIYTLATRTGCIVKWCSIYDFQGIGLDIYATADTSATISNNKIFTCGNGLKLLYGANTISYCVFYKNTIYNVHANYTVQTFNHCVFYGGQYGIYLESNSSTIIITNSIFENNSLYGIYSEVAISIYYCDITDAYNSLVSIYPYTIFYNINDSPLFVNVSDGSEDLNLKVIENGYLVDSPCKEAASDGDDIGAYDITRSTNSDGWKEHRFTYNPRVVNESYVSIGKTTFEDSIGGLESWAKAHKRRFDLKFGNMQYMNATDRKKMFYFLSDIMARENNLTSEETRLRLHFLPSAKEDSGTGATVSATALTLTDATKTWIEDEHKGFWCSIYAASGATNMSIVGATDICTVAAAGWTVDAWIGYYLCIYTNSKVHYFYILDNDATTLTCSDPNGYLDNQTNISWSIVKNYRIASNAATVLTLEDPDDEIVAATNAAYHIDFIMCKISADNIAYSQPRFYRQMENWKMGSELVLQEE